MCKAGPGRLGLMLSLQRRSVLVQTSLAISRDAGLWMWMSLGAIRFNRGLSFASLGRRQAEEKAEGKGLILLLVISHFGSSSLRNPNSERRCGWQQCFHLQEACFYSEPQLVRQSRGCFTFSRRAFSSPLPVRLLPTTKSQASHSSHFHQSTAVLEVPCGEKAQGILPGRTTTVPYLQLSGFEGDYSSSRRRHTNG